MDPLHPLRPLRYRAIWISDLHLGSKASKSEFLLDFLKAVDSEYLYLVGDIIDLWSIQRNGLYWPQSHNDVVRTLLDKARRGVTVVYIPGNHDQPLREYHNATFGNVKVARRHIHTTVSGKRLLVLHGDEFDAVIQCSRLAKRCGSLGYDLLLWTNRWVNHVRRLLGFPYWSLAAYLKTKVGKAARHIYHYEQAARREARRQGADGIVCGHIHHAEMALRDGVLYCNDGDWVENCTALVEDHRGMLHLLHWADDCETLKSEGKRQADTETGERAA